MCFSIRNNEESRTLWVAKDDIVCYKVLLVKLPDDGKTYKSPYQNFTYIKGETYSANMQKPRPNSKGIYMYGRKYWSWLEPNDQIKDLDIGLHTYDSKVSLRSRWAKYNFSYDLLGPKILHVVAKCIIPKGTDFHFDPVLGEYISEKLKFVSIVKY